MPEPEAPRAVPDVTLRPSGKVAVAGSPSLLQGLLDTALPGDRIVCDPSQPWVGNWSIRRPAGGPRVVLASNDDAKPVRFMTATAQPVFTAAGPVGGIHFLNAEITLGPTVDYRGGQSLVQLGTNEAFGQHPRSFVFERCHVFGNPGQDVRRGILTNCGDFAFVDGRITEIHQRGSDSQAICGWSGPGPFLIRDARLEAAGENVMFGGADSVSAAMAPADVTLERCHLFKPLDWKGRGWTVKNLFECKHALRVRVSGCLLENNWGGEGQSGYAIVLTTRNENGRNPWAAVSDVRIEHTEVRNSTAGVNFLGADDRAAAPSQRSARLTLDNLLMGVTGGRLIQIAGGPSAGGPTELVLSRMTATGTASHAAMLTGAPTAGTRWRDLVLVGGQYGIFGDGVGTGGPAIDKYLPGATFDQVYLVSPGGIGGGYTAKGIQVVAAAPAGRGVDLAALQAARIKPGGTIPPPPQVITLQSLDARLTVIERKVNLP